ncbi:MAG: hypothetical protein JKY60_20435 [Kordiimonadaceae bacterium]|nr:hypothetical protein [Kordiimonadaceae bacterium]MBL4791307.1 hypothetical protein [Kordiimonadaceae bacterium]
MDWSVPDTDAEKAQGYYGDWEKTFYGVGFIRRQYGSEPNKAGRLFGFKIFSFHFFFKYEPPYRSIVVRKEK